MRLLEDARSVSADAVGEALTALASPGFSVRPPRILGAELLPDSVRALMSPTWDRSFPPSEVRLIELQNAFCAEQGLIFTADGELVEETRTQSSLEEVHRASERIRREGTPTSAGSYVLAIKSGVWNYGHWLVEMLPRALVARQAGVTATPLGYDLRGSPMGAAMERSTELVLGEPLSFVGPEPVRLERVTLVHGLTDHGGFMSPLALSFVEPVLAAVPAGAGTKRIYVTRQSIGTRLVENEDEVLRLLRHLGFEVVDPFLVPFDEQVALFRGAEVVVGVAGSGLANMAFAPSGAKLVSLVPAIMPDTFFWFITNHRAQEYVEVRCRGQAGPWSRASIKVDLDLLTEALNI